MNEDVRAQKDALENLNTQENIKKDSNVQVFCRKSLKNSELYKPNLRSEHLREWSSRSIRSMINMSKNPRLLT